MAYFFIFSSSGVSNQLFTHWKSDGSNHKMTIEDLLVTMFLWTLWDSMKKIKAPYEFDWEHGIALHAMQGNRASSLSEGEVSWFFSSCGGKLWCIVGLRQG